jgi:DNA/RNA-binding domain of Phe-tRNA-synthetase-like protein
MDTDSTLAVAVAVSDEWRAAFPDARVGLLLLDDVQNGPPSAALLRHVRTVEAELRQRYAGASRADLTSLPTMQAYVRHYRAFGQTYHVLRQLESVALKSKPLDSSSALVLAMFSVELDTLLLTAGHDAKTLSPPLTLDRSVAGDRFVGIGGREQVVREGDMLVRDTEGIISAVIYGPDERSRLTEGTRRAVFATYAPSGISPQQLNAHLVGLASAVGLTSPAATVLLKAIYPQ